MPVTFKLDAEQRIIFWYISDPWTLPQLTVHYNDVIAILDSTDHTINSIIDIRGVHKIPSGILKARYLSTWDHPRNGYALVVGATPLLRNIAEAAFKIARFERASFFPNEDEARAFLETLSPDRTA